MGWPKGKPFSDEHRAKLIEGLKGRTKTERQRQATDRTGTVVPEEARQKIRSALKGRYHERPTEKWCERCNAPRPIDEFRHTYRKHRGEAYPHPYPNSLCRTHEREYMREWHLRHREEVDYQERRLISVLKNQYGLTLKEFQDLMTLQGGGCAICHDPVLIARGKERTRRRLAVDHNHGNGQIRGLLCPNCNRGIGLFGDNPNTLRQAAEYLERAT